MTVAERRKLNTFYEAVGAAAVADQNVEDELTIYRRLRPQRDSDPLQVWAEIEERFPILARLAQIYLAIPAANASVERLFSDAGNVYSEKRGSLSVQSATSLIFLYANRKLFWPEGNVGAIPT